MRKRILLIDDDGDEIMLLRAALQDDADMQYTCVWAEHIHLAIEFLNSSQYDIILIDLNMPRIGGIEGIRMLRAQESARQIPIFLYSTSINEAARSAALKAGANGCLQKSCRLTELSDTLNQLLNNIGHGQ